MNQRIVIVLLYPILAVYALIGCSDNGTQPTPPAENIYKFADFVHFDTTKYVHLKASGEGHAPNPELYLWWEKNLGEPFTDLNGNGVYDFGIDRFVMSADPASNQDLNRNGRYDGPNDPWDPSIPFDDIDGNGTLRQEENPYGLEWTPGVPFCDFNGNGAWDSLPEFNYTMVRCSVQTLTQDSTAYRFFGVDSVYYFRSDANVTYIVPPDNPWNHAEITRLRFTVTAAGLLWGPSVGTVIPVLDSGVVAEGRSVVIGAWVSGSSRLVTAARTISLGDSLTIGIVSYRDLLKVRCDSISFISTPALNEGFTAAFVEFYFSRTAGPLAVILKYSNLDGGSRYYLNSRVDTLPLSMTWIPQP